jgi:hypothetical protein
MTSPRTSRRAAVAIAAIITTTALTTTATTASTGTAPGALVSGRSARVTAVGVSVTTTMTDSDDVAGRLDLRTVGHRVTQLRPQRVRFAYTIETFARYRDGLLESPERELVLELHRSRTRGADRNITVSSVDGQLVATVVSNATREPIGRVHVVRVDARSFRIVGSRALIGARSYFVTSNFHSGGSAVCGWQNGWPVNCQDTVPDSGWIRVDRWAWPEVV